MLSVSRFEDESGAVALANGTRYGLGGFVFTSDVTRAHRLAAAFDAGYVGVNGFPMLPAAAPFGGVKESGFGREGGREGIEEFLRTKNVFVSMPPPGRRRGRLKLRCRRSRRCGGARRSPRW